MRFKSNSRRPDWFVWVPLGAAALLTVGFSLGLGLQRQPGPLVEISAREQLRPNALGVGSIEEILRYIESKYVDEVDRARLIDAAIDDLLAQLDPYSSYISPTQLASHRAKLAGTTIGIGIDVAILSDSVVVVEVLPESPAAKAGLLLGDRLMSVGDSLVSGTGWTLTKVRDQLQAGEGKPIKLQIWRRGEGVLPTVTLSRKTLSLPTVSEAVMLGNGVGYLRIEQFADNTYTEFMEGLEHLVTEQGSKHLVIDMRGNSGGYLDEAVKLLSQFFSDAGRLLVFTQGKHSPRVDYKSSGRVLYPVDKVVLLVDGASASASEIVAGAFQDWDRGTIIGQPTYGKGMVQELFPLKDQGALHITVSRYFTPSGRSIQRSYGLASEIKSSSLADGSNSPLGVSPSVSSIPAQSTYMTAAGRPVLGGGGITPDILIDAAPAEILLREPLLRRAFRNLTFAVSEPQARPMRSELDQIEGLFVALAAAEGRIVTASELMTLRPIMRRLATSDESLVISAKQGGRTQPAARELLADPYVSRAMQFISADSSR